MGKHQTTEGFAPGAPPWLVRRVGRVYQRWRAVRRSRGAEVQLWDLANGEPLAQLFCPQDHPTALAFTPDGRTLASGGLDRSVRFTNVATRQEVAMLPHEGQVRALAFAPDGQTLVTGSDKGEVLLWRAPR